MPTAVYGVVLLMAAIAYYLLQRAIMASQGAGGVLARAVGRDWKGKLSPVVYLAAIALAFVAPWVAQLLYLARRVALVDPRPADRTPARAHRLLGGHAGLAADRRGG